MSRRTRGSQKGDADLLLSLAWLEKRAELSCRVSAEDAREPHCRELLFSLGQQYAVFARDLRMLASHLGGPTPSTPLGGALGSLALLKTLPEERDTSTLLSTCEAVERALVDAYRDARRRAWPTIVDAALDRHVRVHSAARFGLMRRRHGEVIAFADTGS